MQNRTTFLERLNERMTAAEGMLRKLEPVEELLERIASLENSIYTTKKVLTFNEACLYLGVSESLLYKLTSSKEVPHFKPRGKMLYFSKEELDHWLMRNNVPTVGAITQTVAEENEVKPYFGRDRYGKRKKQ